MTEFAHLNRITSLGELSASIAHELNQPRAAILINSEAAELLLAASPPAIEEARRAVRDIRFDNIRAGEIIRGMRSLFNKAEFGLVALDINEIVGETIRFVAWDAKAKDVKIITNLTADLPRVAADRVQLTQVVLNLLTNAVEASGSSSAEEKKVTITSRLATFNDVELSVEDNGSGIPPHVLGQVFNPFYTTKIHGMGMGLSISRTIIEAHGSRIEVQNLKGGGVIFNFKLRRAKDR
jgi:C4-dicarboxylate-specific signal transduction histidine kinase